MSAWDQDGPGLRDGPGDAGGKRRILLSPPHVSEVERDLLIEAFDSNWIAPAGPALEAFEREFADWLGLGQGVALSSGSAGLHLCLHELGVRPGDPVLLSSLTFVATANAVAYCGAVPVLLDSEPASWNLDPDLFLEALRHFERSGRRPKVLVAVDLYGQCADYDRILPLAREWGVEVVEDAAEAAGARYRGRSAGSFGRAGVFSFNGNKILTTGGGGMVVSHDPSFVSRLRHLATQAREPVPHYEHTEVGYNYRLSNLLAAVGRGQLRSIEARMNARRDNRRFYEEALGGLPGVSFQPVPEWSQPNYWLTCLVVDAAAAGTDRESIRVALEAENIESRPVWKPMHLQPPYRSCRVFGGSVSERLFRDGLCLPSGSALARGELERVCEVVRRCFPA